MISGIKIEGNFPDVKEQVDFGDLLRMAGEIMYTSVMTNFWKGGRPVWRALASGEPSHLIKSGFMQSAIDRRVGPDFVEVYIAKSVVPYAFIHQFGGMAGRGRKTYIPARPYMMFQEQDKETILELFQRRIMDFIITQRRIGP